MLDDRIPSNLREFISAHIRSVGHLELLLLLFIQREHPWSVQQLSLEMRTNEQMVQQQLLDLQKIISIENASSPLYQFDNSNGIVLERVTSLAEFYRSRRYAVIEEIYRPRSDSLRSFADAFKIKKDD